MLLSERDYYADIKASFKKFLQINPVHYVRLAYLMQKCKKSISMKKKPSFIVNMTSKESAERSRGTLDFSENFILD